MTSKKKKVMIVEDDKALLGVITLKLKSSGFEVLGFDNGREAIEKMDNEKPDILITDLMLPGMDGFSLIKEIRQEMKNDIPIFVLSNLGQVEDKNKVKKLGVQEYFIKSDMPLKKLVEQIEKILK